MGWKSDEARQAAENTTREVGLDVEALDEAVAEGMTIADVEEKVQDFEDEVEFEVEIGILDPAAAAEMEQRVEKSALAVEEALDH